MENAENIEEENTANGAGKDVLEQAENKEAVHKFKEESTVPVPEEEKNGEVEKTVNGVENAGMTEKQENGADKGKEVQKEDQAENEDATVERKESVFGGKDDTQIQPLANGLTIHYDIEKPCDGLHEPVRPDAVNDNGSALRCTVETKGKKLADVNMNGSQASEPTSLGLDLTNYSVVVMKIPSI